MLSAMSSMVLNQHYILNKAFLIRNTPNIRFYTYQWAKICDRDLQEPNPAFPLGAMA